MPPLSPSGAFELAVALLESGRSDSRLDYIIATDYGFAYEYLYHLSNFELTDQYRQFLLLTKHHMLKDRTLSAYDALWMGSNLRRLGIPVEDRLLQVILREWPMAEEYLAILEDIDAVDEAEIFWQEMKRHSYGGR